MVADPGLHAHAALRRDALLLRAPGRRDRDPPAARGRTAGAGGEPLPAGRARRVWRRGRLVVREVPRLLRRAGRGAGHLRPGRRTAGQRPRLRGDLRHGLRGDPDRRRRRARVPPLAERAAGGRAARMRLQPGPPLRLDGRHPLPVHVGAAAVGADPRRGARRLLRPRGRMVRRPGLELAQARRRPGSPLDRDHRAGLGRDLPAGACVRRDLRGRMGSWLGRPARRHPRARAATRPLGWCLRRVGLVLGDARRTGERDRPVRAGAVPALPERRRQGDRSQRAGGAYVPRSAARRRSRPSRQCACTRQRTRAGASSGGAAPARPRSSRAACR